MATKQSTQSTTNSDPETYIIEIKAIPPVAFAVPGIRKVRQGDYVIFDNKTGGEITVTMAANGVLDGMDKLDQKTLKHGPSKPFRVKPDSGTHEISVHYEYTEEKNEKKKLRTGFAIGASSPKIIIVR